MRRLLIAPVLAGLVPMPVAAQQSIDANFAKLRHSKAYQDAVLGAAYRTAAWINEKCSGSNPSLGDHLGELAAPVVNEDGQPQSGLWGEHVFVDGCQRRWQLNVLVGVQKPGSLALRPMLPGTTHADPTLQKDAATYAFLAARIDPNGCKPVYLADTAYVGPKTEAPAVPGKPAWSERWTVAQCTKRTDIELSFVPDASGTAISAKVVNHP